MEGCRLFGPALNSRGTVFEVPRYGRRGKIRQMAIIDQGQEENRQEGRQAQEGAQTAWPTFRVLTLPVAAPHAHLPAFNEAQ